jgi:hypothetical protein
MEKPFFLSSFWEDILKTLPCFQEDPPSGFGYPLDGLRSSTLGSLFQPPTLMGFTLQSFNLLFSGRNEVSLTPFRSCAFLHNLISHAPALQRFHPTKKAEPFVATRRISPGQGRMLSWAFRPPRFSLPTNGLKSISLFKLPSHSYPPSTSQQKDS